MRLSPSTHPSDPAPDGTVDVYDLLLRSNSRRFMPSQAEEETHQLSYIQKHMGNILAPLAEPVEGEGDESLVFTMERFEHLGFLQFSEGIPLRQGAPCFANSDPDMPAVPVSSSQVHEWVVQNIIASLEHNAEKGLAKENDATVILGAVGKAVRVEHCERVQIIAAVKRMRIANCLECVFYLGVNQQPLFDGDNHKLQVAPFNTYYAQLEEHLSQVGVDSNINRWGEPLVLGMVDPHDSFLTDLERNRHNVQNTTHILCLKLTEHPRRR
ncbi:hypothetical protein ZIOFF_072469 [Zingiber officinale]|uniref:C-CAP/cofactor C-like domain-containing protein n=1 Tax=Zingiber officinale TaxID=94328 RepID=A0A8J5BAQ4_ZINOF|nr:hypothetical protein ZIOFF_072469 [Zingiber officinale]